jgi:hypothetical protein
MSAGLPPIGSAYDQNSTALAICEATGLRSLTFSDISLCAEYLCGTTFSSLAAFTHYMQFNNRLQVPANQALIVKDIRLLTDNVSEKPLPIKTRGDYHLSILRRAVAPLARSCRVVLPTGEDVRARDFVSKTGDDFTLRPVRDLQIVLTETPINMRLSDLYRMMLVCSIPHVSFDSRQKLIIWGGPDNQCVDNPCPNIRAHVVNLFNNTYALSGIKAFATWSSLDVTPVESGSAKGMQITGAALTIFLNDYYTFNAKEFQKRMAAIGEINIPPNQPLVIKDPFLLEAFDRFEKEPELGNRCSFVLNQLVLILGKCISYDDLMYEFIREEGAMILSHSDGFRLQLSPGPLLLTNLYHFGCRMIMEGRMSLTIAPNQPVCILGVNSDELVKSAEDLRRDWYLFTLRRSPSIFFNWHFLGPNQSAFITGPHLGRVTISSAEGFSITLKPTSCVELIIGILRRTPSPIIQDIKQMNSSALRAVLAKTLGHFTDTTIDISPYGDLFSNATQDKLRVLRDEDAEFRAACSEVVNNDNLVEQWMAILETPEDFIMPTKNELHAALKVLINKIKALALEEMEQTEFFVHLQEAIKFMEDNNL